MKSKIFFISVKKIFITKYLQLKVFKKTLEFKISELKKQNFAMFSLKNITRYTKLEFRLLNFI